MIRIFQVLPSIAFGDAVSNDALAIHDLLRIKGYETQIYSEGICSKLQKERIINPLSHLPDLYSNDIILYHLAIGTEFNNIISTLKCKKIAIYHNITPPEFFEDYSQLYVDLCKLGLDQVKKLNNTFDYVLADSDFNKQDLVNMGFTAKINVLPILIAFEDYEKKPSKYIMKKYEDDFQNLIFVGRVAPNKKHEDLIRFYEAYKRNINPKSRLILVGSYEGMDLYKERLDNYIKALGVKDVIFTGKIPFSEILAYYKVANLFMCTSEHEGFCVPLVEAMYFDVPIIAYNSTAIPWTLGDSGVLMHRKDDMDWSLMINKLLTDFDYREQVLIKQRLQLQNFNKELVSEKLLNYLSLFVEQEFK